MYKLKFTKLQNEIFRLLSIKAGMSLNQRELARKLNVSPTAIAKALPLLDKENLVEVKKSREMNLNFIQFNRDSQKAIEFKRVENLKLIYESGLSPFLEEHFPGCTIILFGSYSLGEDTISSDIDIAVIGSKQKEIDLTKFHKLLERVISIQCYSSLKRINKELRENILRGIILEGGIEL